MRFGWLPLLGCCAACVPSFEDAPERVVAPRILALQVEPAEVRPGEAMQLRSFVVGPGGPLTGATVNYALCLEPRRLEERNGVSAACVAGGDALQPIPAAQLVMPLDACARFGPHPPPAAAGEAPRRPADPDASGGFYQPIRAQLEGTADAVFAFARIRCDPARADLATFRRFQQGYVNNGNPGAPELEVTGDALQVVLPAESAEAYLSVDAAQRDLLSRREALELSLFITDGFVTPQRWVIPETEASDEARMLQAIWARPGGAWVYAVLRDARGGVSWSLLELSE